VDKLSVAVVTGGAGFIGSHLVGSLLLEGFKVIVLDNFFTGSFENIRTYMDNPRLQIIKGDVRRKRVVREILREADYVFHLAAIASIPLSFKKPRAIDEVNVIGTINLLEESLNSHVEKFIFTSSCAVYGRPIYIPIDENHPTNPLSPYGISKLSAEHYCRVFYETYGLKTVILRLFNVYGPGQERSPYRGVISSFIDALRSGRAPVIFGDGEQTRDFVFISDVINALMLALKAKDVGGMTFNIGSGVETSINKVAEYLLKIFRLNVKPIYAEARAGDIRRSCANINRAREILGFKANISLDEGLKRYVKALAW